MLLRLTTTQRDTTFMDSFDALGLGAPLKRALAGLNYTAPTPIQARALPVAISGRDLIACAQTGSGKTAVFALPFLQRLIHSGHVNTGKGARPVRCLVLVPTRELAIQVEGSFRAYGKHLPFRSAAVYGGVGYGAQLAALRGGVDVLVATPGRLIDHLERRAIRLDTVEYLVLDEADRMLDMGFLPQVRRVIAEGRVPAHGRQTLLFSATMPPQIAQLARDLLKDPVRVEAHTPMSAVSSIEQRLYPVAPTQKAELLTHLMGDESVESAIIFARTRRRADSLSRVLNRAGLKNETYHSGVPQNRRQSALLDFRRGRIKFLVATDVAARGLDVPHLSHVVNHDVPDVAEDYVHRIGRTGRAGRSGVAITLYSHADEALWQAVEKLTAIALDPTHLGGFRYIPDTSRPEMTRRQREERARAERMSAGSSRASGPSSQPTAREPAPAGRSSPTRRPASRPANRGADRNRNARTGRSR
jgi:ATP-dependent RNA helicase RhlE